MNARRTSARIYSARSAWTGSIVMADKAEVLLNDKRIQDAYLGE